MAERGKSAAEGVFGRGGKAVRKGVWALDPKAAGAQVSRGGACVKPARAVPNFAELGRGVGGGEGRDDAKGDVGVGGEEGAGAIGRGCFAAEGGVAFNGESVVESVAMIFLCGVAQGCAARVHGGEGEGQAEEEEWREVPKTEGKGVSEKCREEGGEGEEGPGGREVVVGKAEGFTGGEGRAN